MHKHDTRTVKGKTLHYLRICTAHVSYKNVIRALCWFLTICPRTVFHQE